MKVISRKGTQCPKENNPREYITDSKPVDVPETVYYQRLINDGSLSLIADGSEGEGELNKKGGKGK